MNFVYLIIVMVSLQFFFFGIMVGVAREKFQVKAPAISGNEHFERYFRVHANTLEQLIQFIPALLIAAQFWKPEIMAAIGVVFFVGRIIYYKQYVADPAKRSLGFALTMLPTLILLLASLVGIIKSFI